MPEGLESHLKTFADDTKVIREIRNIQEYNNLQKHGQIPNLIRYKTDNSAT